MLSPKIKEHDLLRYGMINGIVSNDTERLNSSSFEEATYRNLDMSQQPQSTKIHTISKSQYKRIEQAERMVLLTGRRNF